MNMLVIESMLKLFAAQALPFAEQKGVEWWYKHGTKMVSAEKRREAINTTVRMYRDATDSIPFIKDTDFDDKVIENLATQAVDAAWKEMGKFINRIGRPAMVNDKSLPKGGLQ